jgi:exodeoxyribonuclease VII large subunit
LDVYAARGTYQLVVNEIQPRGLGALELAFRQLHQRLAAEGLFAPERKRPLPRFPRRIAVITSPTGAAIRDFLEVLRRRWRGVDVWILPVRVQGVGSAQEVVRALSPFNEEPVVRAVANCEVPIISAIGHEIDVTLCDLAADVRALTPSEAAERIAPAADELRTLLLHKQRHLVSALRRRAMAARARLEAVGMHRALRRPFERVFDLSRHVDELSIRASRAARYRVEQTQGNLRRLAAQLESLSPVATLARGYSITELADSGELVRATSQLTGGDRIRTRLAQGAIVSRVESLEDGEAAS